MKDGRMVRIGGICGIILGVVQLAGIVLHGSIPADPAEGLAFVNDHPAWVLTHVLLILSYLVVVGFYVGFRASFRNEQPLLEVGANLTLVGALLGAIHFTIHLSIYPFLARTFIAGPEGYPLATRELLMYHSVHHYAHVLNRCSLFLLMTVAFIFALLMLREKSYRRWIGYLGVISSAVTVSAVLVAELFLSRATGDIVFAVALLPTIVWIVAVGVSMIKMTRPDRGSERKPVLT